MIKINDIEIKFEKFPNNEMRLDKKQFEQFKEGSIHVNFKYGNDEDLFKLFIVKKYLDEIRSNYTIDNYPLWVTYYPYSRMDRDNPNYVFTLKYVAEYLNNMGWGAVNILEPHSHVCKNLTNKSNSVFVTSGLLKKYLSEMDFDKDKDFLLFPDKGAYDRYNELFPDYTSIYAEKKRNFETGRIEDLTINDLGIDISDTNIIIIDDLCSRGGTFLWAADKLKEKGVNKIYFVVGHCEDTIYEGDLLKNNTIEKIFTTNSIIDKSREIGNRLFIKEVI